MMRQRITATIERARRASDARMLDRCVVTRGGDGGTLDAEGVWTPDEGEVVYEGPCWLGRLDAVNDPRRRTDQLLTHTPFSLVVLFTAGPFEVGDVARIVSARDPHSEPRRWRVTNVPSDSWQVDRRLAVEEVIDGG